MQIETILVKRIDYPNDCDCPPTTIRGKLSPVPLRPLYFDSGESIAKRAIPLSWTEGVPYK